LPAGDELAVGDLGLLGEGPLASADLLEGIGGRGALAPAPRRHAGAQLQRPELLVGERGPGEGIVLVADYQVLAQRGELAGGGQVAVQRVALLRRHAAGLIGIGCGIDPGSDDPDGGAGHGAPEKTV
jgi:hypothetical protein